MAKTNAEKQREYRQRMRDRGFTQRLIWLPKEMPTPKFDDYGKIIKAKEVKQEKK